MTNQKKLSKVERVLRVFTDVRPGEGVTALLLFANVFLILCAYYFIKPLREGWIAVSDIGGFTKMEVKAYSSFGQSVLLVFVVGAYGRYATRLNRRVLISRATLFCMSNMVIFWFLQPKLFVENLPGSGIAFYLWVGMFGVFVVAQFWTFAADLYTDEQGRRLMPMVAIGATGGAAAGSGITTLLLRSPWVSTEALLLIALVPLSISIALTQLVDSRGPAGERRLEPPPPPAPRPGAPRKGAVRLVLFHRFLLPVAILTLLLSWVNTNGENLLFRVLQEFLTREAARDQISDPATLLAFTRNGTTAFYGNFYFWVNVIALLLQSLVASRLLRYGGFAAILLMMPVVALFSYTTMALVPILMIVKWMKIAENATDYSINNTARHVLWLPVSKELKYKGKPTVDTLFVRIGDGLAALTVVVGVQLYAFATETFFLFTVALVLIWLAVAIVVIREHRRASEEELTHETA